MKSVGITREFDKLVRAFEAAPVQTRDMVRRQVKMAVRDVREYARDHHRFVTRSGMTEKSIMSLAKDNQGTVMLTNNIARWQHEGTKAHLIVPRSKKGAALCRKQGICLQQARASPRHKGGPFSLYGS